MMTELRVFGFGSVRQMDRLLGPLRITPGISRATRNQLLFERKRWQLLVRLYAKKFKISISELGHLTGQQRGILTLDEVKISFGFRLNAKTGHCVGQTMVAVDWLDLVDIHEWIGSSNPRATSSALQFLWRHTLLKFDVMGPHYTSHGALNSFVVAKATRRTAAVLAQAGFLTSLIVADGAGPNWKFFNLVCGLNVLKAPWFKDWFDPNSLVFVAMDPPHKCKRTTNVLRSDARLLTKNYYPPSPGGANAAHAPQPAQPHRGDAAAAGPGAVNAAAAGPMPQLPAAPPAGPVPVVPLAADAQACGLPIQVTFGHEQLRDLLRDTERRRASNQIVPAGARFTSAVVNTDATSVQRVINSTVPLHSQVITAMRGLGNTYVATEPKRALALFMCADYLQACRNVFVDFFFTKTPVTSMDDPRWALMWTGVAYFRDWETEVRRYATASDLTEGQLGKLLPSKVTLKQLFVCCGGVTAWAKWNFARYPRAGGGAVAASGGGSNGSGDGSGDGSGGGGGGGGADSVALVGGFAFVPARISQSKLEHLFGYVRGVAGVNNLTEEMFRKGLLVFSFLFDSKHFGDVSEFVGGGDRADDLESLYVAGLMATLREY